jgi:hypothetical protein
VPVLLEASESGALGIAANCSTDLHSMR